MGILRSHAHTTRHDYDQLISTHSERDQVFRTMMFIRSQFAEMVITLTLLSFSECHGGVSSSKTFLTLEDFSVGDEVWAKPKGYKPFKGIVLEPTATGSRWGVDPSAARVGKVIVKCPDGELVRYWPKELSPVIYNGKSKG